MKLVLEFGKPGYIAHPYWIEQHKLIEITKQSGMNRARTDANRRRALQAHLAAIGMKLDEFYALEAAASRPFHTNGTGAIIIPSDKILSCLVNASLVAPARLRVQNIRAALVASDFLTTKHEADGLWERFAVVTGAQGKLSNQRGLRTSAYIRDFTATGTIETEPDMVSPKAVQELIGYAGRNVGIGASRKMGWGRFTVAVVE